MERSEEQEKEETRAEVVRRVFEYWKIRMGKKRARLDDKRRQKINQRLNDGYEERDLIDAIDGCAMSPFHNGTERRPHSDRYSATAVYDDLELILRDAKHVDQFISIKERQLALEAKRRAEEERLRKSIEEAEQRRRERLFSPLRAVK